MSDPTKEQDDAYLWDRTGEPDADVARLESLLAPLRGTGAPRGTPLLGLRRRSILAIAATVAAVASVALWWATRDDDTPAGEIPVVADAGERIDAGSWIESGDRRREVRFGDIGHVTLEPGSRLQVARAAADRTRFFLERGALEAVVSATARPRFFEIGTPAADCIDLGCRYELEVDAEGVAHVRVLTGQVAFETPGREVYVPAGATCVARRDRGPGTPRFETASDELAAAADAYDAAAPGSPERRERAVALLALVRAGPDALPAWHLLADADPATAEAAREALTARFGAPAEPTLAGWRAHLEPGW